jgi:hypothetical protein
MGYNTVAVLYNDFTDDFWRRGVDLGPRIADAMTRYHDLERDPLGRHFQAGMVISQDHASGEQVVLVTKNTGWRLEDAPEVGWHALQQMQRCLERHGYQVIKPQPKRRVKAIELTKVEAEFVSEMSHDKSVENSWQNFDPDFRQKDIARLLRRGWFERHVDEGGYRQYRWTDAGRSALMGHTP